MNEITCQAGPRGSVGIQGEDIFVLQHPDLRRVLPNLLGIYAACQRRRLEGNAEDIEDAYQHAYIRRGGCSWCQYHLEMVKESLEDEAAAAPL